jgi:hypothetical protein
MYSTLRLNLDLAATHLEPRMLADHHTSHDKAKKAAREAGGDDTDFG